MNSQDKNKDKSFKNIFLKYFNIIKAYVKKKQFKNFFYKLRNFYFLKNKNNFKSNKELNKKLVYSLAGSKIPNFRQLKYIRKFLSSRELLLIKISFFVIFFSTSFLVGRFYLTHLQIVPVSGGEYIEGLIGSPPQFINPIYAELNSVDSDISSLIYSSLFKIDKNFNLKKDLVLDYEISSDGKIYTMLLRDNVAWHNNKGQFSRDDVIYTFDLIKDKKYNSPLRANFEGINIEKVVEDEHKIRFILEEPYAPFLELLTFGIMPKSIWSEIPIESFTLTQYNKKPIGTGPYTFNDIKKTEEAGIIREYSLVPNQDYYDEVPRVNLIFKFYQSYEEAITALNNDTINGISYLPDELKNQISIPKTYNFNSIYMSEIDALFFNQEKNNILKDKSVRKALAYAIDKNSLVSNTLSNNAITINSPIFISSFAYANELEKYNFNLLKSQELLDKSDWKIVEIKEEDLKIENQKDDKKLKVGPGKWRMKNNDYLVINLSFLNNPKNLAIVEHIKNNWEAIGVKTNLHSLEENDLLEGAVLGKEFEVLLYSYVDQINPDPYPFWHSSQIGGSGLNISKFKNDEVDKLLTEARQISDENIRKEKYKRFQEIIIEEVPAIFIYSPTYTYLQNKKIKNYSVNSIVVPNNRFANISEWYIETGKKIIW